MLQAPLPISLKIVAYLFILTGVGAIIEMISALFHNRISLNFSALEIFVGLGLLRLNPCSWTWARFLTVLGLVFGVILGFIFLFTPGSLRLFGVPFGQAPPGLGVVISLVVLALLAWQLRVLNGDAVRRLFGR